MTKHQHPEERAEQILSAARACFLEKGYAATKMDEIAKKSGLSKGGIYFHFSGKSEIFRSLVQHEYDSTMAFIDGVMVNSDNFALKFIELGEHFVTLFGSSDRPMFMGIIVEMALRDDDIAALIRDLQMNYFQQIARLIDIGIEAGDIRPVDSYACAVVLKALIDGVQANFAIGVELEFERVIAAGLELLARGFAPD